MAMVMEAPESQPAAQPDDRPLVRVVCIGTRIAKSTGDRVRCTHMFFFAHLRDATIEIQCPKCETMNTIDRRPA